MPFAIRRLAAAISIALTTATAHAAVDTGDRYVVVEREAAAKHAVSGERVADYGAFQLLRLDRASAAPLKAGASDGVRAVDNRITFEAGAYDPLSGVIALPAQQGFQPAAVSGSSVELVQFVGPIADDWEERLHVAGLTVLQYIPNNAYLVLADAKGRSLLAGMLANDPTLRLAETLQPIYKLDRQLAGMARAGLSAQREVEVTVTLARYAANAASKSTLTALALGKGLGGWSPYGALEAVTLRVRESDIETLAQLADVVAVERHAERRLMDEVQNMIVAGEFADATQTGPNAPGYLAWLAARGFSTTPADYPIVAVVDDGVGNGSTTLGAGDSTLTVDGANSVSRLAFTVNCTGDASADGAGGHGHINTSIVGGYDTRSGFPFKDPDGFLRGLGVNPFARLGHAKIFANSGSYSISNCGGSDVTLIRNTYLGGARISSNSWGTKPGNGDYTSDSAIYDAATRDADQSAPGLQPMIFVFAAGNDGAGASTVGAPGTAKNVITVGASENDRPSDEDGSWTDGCQTPASGANSAMDVIGFSSRGPVEGGRVKPEVIAPGTHIQGTASTSGAYNGNGVCDKFHPSGQSVYAASSGTSHSTPAVAGLTSLTYRFIEANYGLTPSPALMKAYLMAHPTYLTGVSANDTLPSNSQGYGMPNLGLAFDNAAARLLVDQADVLGATGNAFNYSKTIDNSGNPTRIALTWTDAPGATSGNPQVNNLDLEVTAGGNTYKGNVFSGGNSVSGGNADTANNYEAVFLPAGTSGPIDIRVVGTSIAGDGVPGNGDSTDQDFAIVCSNCTSNPTFSVNVTETDASTCGNDTALWNVAVSPFLGYTGTVSLATTDLPAAAVDQYTPASGAVPLNASLSIATAGLASGAYAMNVSATDGNLTRTAAIVLDHASTLAAAPTPSSPSDGATDVSTQPTLTWAAVTDASSYVVEISTDPDFANLADSASVTTTSYTPTSLVAATTHYWRVRSLNGCGTSGNSLTASFTTAAAYCATPGLAIPDNNAAGVSSNITIPTGASLADLDVVLDASHTWMGDLQVSLSRAGGTPIMLMDRPGVPATSSSGCNGNDPDIVFDDEGTDGAVETACAQGSNPAPGYPAGARLTPDQALSTFDGQDAAATWTLTVRDRAGQDTGTLNRWCLAPSFAGAGVTALADGYNTNEDTVLNIAAPGVLDNDSGGGLSASVVSNPARGALTLAANGGFDYTPQADDCGDISFGYRASDGSSSADATVTISIACLNDAPVAVADSGSTTVGGTLSVAAPGVLENDTDVDGNPLQAVLAAGPAHASSFTLDADGGFSYTHNGNGASSDSFSYKASDGQLESTIVQVNIILQSPNGVFRDGFE